MAHTSKPFIVRLHPDSDANCKGKPTSSMSGGVKVHFGATRTRQDGKP